MTRIEREKLEQLQDLADEAIALGAEIRELEAVRRELLRKVKGELDELQRTTNQPLVLTTWISH